MKTARGVMRGWMKLQERGCGIAGTCCHFARLRSLDDAEEQTDDQITP